MADHLDDLRRLLAESVYDTPTIRWAVAEIERLRTDNAQLHFALEQSEVGRSKLVKHHNDACTCGQIY